MVVVVAMTNNELGVRKQVSSTVLVLMSGLGLGHSIRYARSHSTTGSIYKRVKEQSKGEFL